jgi:hypothetical protein
MKTNNNFLKVLDAPAEERKGLRDSIAIILHHYIKYRRGIMYRSTASEKIEQDKLQLQFGTVLNNVQQLSISAAEFEINIRKFELNNVVAELNRTPKKTYTNLNIKNETESLISGITDFTWLQIFSYLDLRSLALIMISCKKMAHLTNDNKTRERLYKSKKYHFFNEFIPKTTVLEPFCETSEVARLIRRQEQHPVQQFELIPQTQQVFNDNPPGRGFVMK